MKSLNDTDEFFRGLNKPLNALMSRTGLAFLLGLMTASLTYSFWLGIEVSQGFVFDFISFFTLSVDIALVFKVVLTTVCISFWYFFITGTPLSKLNADWVNALATLVLFAVALACGLINGNWLLFSVILLWGCILGIYKVVKGEGLNIGLGTDLGKARFDDGHQALDEQGLLEEEGFIIGLPIGKTSAEEFIRFKGEGHLLSFASTGAGKGIGIVVPNLLTYRGSIVVLDIKGENFLNTIYHQSTLGKQACLIDPFFEVEAQLERKVAKLRSALQDDPLNAKVIGDALDYYESLVTKVQPGGAYIYGINPLEIIEELRKQGNYDAIFDEASVLADTIVIKNEGEKDPHWNEKSVSLIRSGILLLVFADPYEDYSVDLVSVKKIILDLVQDDNLLNEINSLCLDVQYPHYRYLKDIPAGLNLIGNEEKSSVLSNFLRHTDFISSPYAADSLTSSSTSLLDLKHNFKTIYLVLPAGKLEAYTRLMRLWITTLMQAMVRTTDSPARRVLFLLDEVAQLGRLSGLVQAVSLMRGYGLNLWMIFQDIPQLKETYGGKWQSFIANSKIHQYFSVNDAESSEFISRHLGTTTVTTESFTASQADEIRGFFAQINKTYASTARPLMLPEEVRLFSDQIIFHQGNLPIRARRIKYYDDPFFIDNYPSPFVLPEKYRSL